MEEIKLMCSDEVDYFYFDNNEKKVGIGYIIGKTKKSVSDDIFYLTQELIGLSNFSHELKEIKIKNSFSSCRIISKKTTPFLLLDDKYILKLGLNNLVSLLQQTHIDKMVIKNNEFFLYDNSKNGLLEVNVGTLKNEDAEEKIEKVLPGDIYKTPANNYFIYLGKMQYWDFYRDKSVRHYAHISIKIDEDDLAYSDEEIFSASRKYNKFSNIRYNVTAPKASIIVRKIDPEKKIIQIKHEAKKECKHEFVNNQDKKYYRPSYSYLIAANIGVDKKEDLFDLDKERLLT